jgi:toxin HigB-1
LPNGLRVRRWVNIERVALRKREQFNIASVFGDWIGQRSLRVYDQWCVCFFWDKEGQKDVEIVDYR